MPWGKPWTRVEECRLVALVKAGVRYPAAAIVLGRPWKAVERKGYHLGLRCGPQMRAHDAAVRRLNKKGWFDWEVGLELGITGSRVARIRARLGIPANHWRQSEIAKRREAKKRGAA